MESDPESVVARAVERARERMEKGRLTVADFLLRDALEILPTHPGAQAALADLKRRVGGIGTPGDGGEYHLLIKPWSQGFWSEMNHVLGCLLLAEVTGRVPIVHWGADSLFGDGARDVFRLFWEPVGPHGLEGLVSNPPRSIFPGKWSVDALDQESATRWNGPGSRLGVADFLGRTEPLIVCDFYVGVIDVLPWLPQEHRLFGAKAGEATARLFQDYLRPRPDLLDAAKDLAARFDAHRAVAVHLRGTDKVQEVLKLDTVRAAYVEVIRHLPPDTPLFVMTDDAGQLAWAKSLWGNRVFHSDCQRSESEVGPHFRPDFDPVRLGREIMIDTYAALQCSGFVGMGHSNVSEMIELMKPWPPGRCLLLGFDTRLYDQRNLYLHYMGSGG